MAEVSQGDIRDAEIATIRAFVLSARQDRWLAALDSPTRRKKTLRFYDSRDMDQRWAEPATGPAHRREAVEARLRSLGAPDDCLLMEEIEAPTRRLPLQDALRTVFDEGQWGSLVICVPGTLAYQELEQPAGGMLYLRNHG